MASEEVEVGEAAAYEEIGGGKASDQAGTTRKPRSDKGTTRLPPRKSLLLSRAASARFARVAGQLKGGEEELAELLEGVVDKLFAGMLLEMTAGEPRQLGCLEDLALAAVAARMKGGSDA